MATRRNYDWTNGNADMAATTVGSPGWWLDRLTRRLVARSTGDMVRFQRYYDGDHYGSVRGASFIGDRLAFLMGPQFRRICVNYCEVVVDKLIERLEVTGFTTGAEPVGENRLWKLWQANDLDQEFAKGLREGAVKGEFSLALWPDAKGRPQIRPQDPLNVVVATDPEDRRVRRAALKRWFDEDAGVWYATLYLPTQIWKFQADAEPVDPLIAEAWRSDMPYTANPWLTWQPRVLPGDAPFVFANPFGEVPMVAFPNKPGLNGVGTSELRNIVPIQDAVNKLNYDLLLASEFAAFPQKWAVNAPIEVGPDGKVKSPWELGVDRILLAGPPEEGASGLETKFGQFEPAELANWINALESKLREIAVISRMPPHYLLGQSGVFPSGESLRAAETGLVQKAKDRWRDYAEPLEHAMRLAARMAGHTDIAANESLKTEWRDPETRTESEHLNALVQMATLGVPRQALWKRIPATPTEITDWLGLIAAGDVIPVNTMLRETADVTGNLPESAAQGASDAATAATAAPKPTPARQRRLRVTRDAAGTTVEEVA